MSVAPLRPAWRSATFLEYLGTLVALLALGVLFDALEEEHGTGGLVGWSALAVPVFVAVAVVVARRGEALVAGLVAFVAVFGWAVFVGSLLDWLGWVSETEGEDFFHEGLALGFVLLEVLVIAGAAVALRRTGLPLLVLPIGAVVWYAVMDLLEGVLGGGNTATALLALAVGLAFVLTARAYDGGDRRSYALWLHVIGGISVGGAVLWFWHEHVWEWLLVLAVSLVYVAVARSFGRSSYAVLGAAGILATATYFVERWFSLGSLVPFVEAEPSDVDEWGRPLVYLAVGAVLVGLGLLVDARRTRSPTPPAP